MIVLAGRVSTDLVTERNFKKISRLCNRLVMVAHKAERLPLHFQNVPEAKPSGAWGYKRRTKDYQVRKAKMKRHQRPLVFSGELERAVLTSARVTATANRARVIARGSNTSKFLSQYKEEVEAVSSQEQKEMGKLWEQTFQALVERPEFKRKRRARNSAGQFI